MRAVAGVLAILCAVAIPAKAQERIVEVATGAVLEEAELAARLAGADLVILGEVHDNPLHHALQARLVGTLAPGGLAFEQIPERSEGVVNGLLRHGTPAAEIGAEIGWDRLGWPDWSEYAAIVAAAPGAHVAGGGIERPILMRAIREGAAAAWPDAAADWGLDRELPAATLAAMQAEMMTAHCGLLPIEAARGMVEAQRLRDARFGAALLRAQQQGTDGRAVLITGNGHARRDRGVPYYLAVMAPDLSLVTVGIMEGEGLAAGLPYDFVAFTPVAPRPDPCEGLARELAGE